MESLLRKERRNWGGLSLYIRGKKNDSSLRHEKERVPNLCIRSKEKKKNAPDQPVLSGKRKRKYRTSGSNEEGKKMKTPLTPQREKKGGLSFFPHPCYRREEVGGKEGGWRVLFF